MSVRTLGNVLLARLKRERIETYGADMMYIAVKRQLRNDAESPSKMAERLYKPPTKPKSVQQIKADILRKLG